MNDSETISARHAAEILISKYDIEKSSLDTVARWIQRNLEASGSPTRLTRARLEALTYEPKWAKYLAARSRNADIRALRRSVPGWAIPKPAADPFTLDQWGPEVEHRLVTEYLLAEIVTNVTGGLRFDREAFVADHKALWEQRQRRAAMRRAMESEASEEALEAFDAEVELDSANQAAFTLGRCYLVDDTVGPDGDDYRSWEEAAAKG